MRSLPLKLRYSRASVGLSLAGALLPVAAMLLVCLAGCNKTAQHAPDVWATVNGKEIKRDDVEKYYRTRVNPEGPPPSQEEALSLKLNVLDELINNEILIERAKKLNLEASDGEVEDKFTELKSPYTEDEFQKQLKDRNVTVDDLKSDLRRQLSIQKLLNREVVAKISITDQDVTDFYNANKAQFNVAEPQFRLAQIVVTPRKEPQIRNRKNDDATNEAEAERKVKMLTDRLNSGADFAQLAMDYSEDMNSAATGGDLGYVPESALNQSDPQLKKIVLSSQARPSKPADSLKDGVTDFEIDYARIAGAARHWRSPGAANHSRYAAQPQGATAARRVSGHCARRRSRHELPCRTGYGKPPGNSRMPPRSVRRLNRKFLLARFA